MLATEWLKNTRDVMSCIEETQMENIQKAAAVMADTIACGRWVHTFGCGHATLPIEEMYPRIGGFVGFHPMIEIPLSFFTHITGEMGVHQFVFLERVEGYGVEIMKGYTFDQRDTMWLFSHSGINNVNIDIALESKKRGMKVVVFGSAAAARGKKTRHTSGKTIFDIADIVVD
ncbi:MAG TPA: sugar isomerase domain-containing protein, partial [Bacteroidales bacterium]|nr:sugar isomerase domain-containing protein [Bacteroidales bacterium]